ncbi:helix-turn-helix domain-containing protein [Nocardiopsis sp. NRRL B-16309]|uniref:helix-turn-helix domain-containing protein n=1 Tax=Nocardiopsis sp. NRRL B-16309 TaxID=1519494 RepID=UPI0006B06AF4|nr:helix-turn-helix transcriptional regulator [Nocardiopsis sp. NRRL B-16309]KOX16706.1 XRE family transcriptional regulator [Nocardiopsis sp. NRRL B-16309]
MTDSVPRSLDEARQGGAPAEERQDPLMRDLIGDLLRRTRNEQGRTLREVAEDAQVSLPYLSEIERGRKEASSEVLAAVYRSLGLSLSDVLAELYRRTALIGLSRTGTGAGDFRRAGAHVPAPVRHRPQVMSLAA